MVAGRHDELQRLERVLADAHEAIPHPLLLVGEPGMGKSTLLHELGRMARDRGFQVVAAGCPEGSGQIRYGLLDDLVQVQPTLVDALHPDDGKILADLTQHRAPGPNRVATAMLRLLTRAAQDVPILVIVDDLHEADADSRAVLTLVSGRLLGRRIALVAACRPGPADPRLDRWERLHLGPLDLDSSVTLLRASVPDAPAACLTPARARQLADVLGRNPTALRDCPRLLAEDELCGTAVLPDPLPVGERLASAWRRAFDGLPPAQQDAVLAAILTDSHGGRTLLADVLGALGADMDHVHEGLRALAGGSSRAPSDNPPLLSQPLVRSAVLAAAGTERAGSIRMLAAQAAAARGLSPAVVVAHLAAGARRGDHEAVAVLEQQAERAIRLGRHADAARALESAASICDQPDRRARLAAGSARLWVEAGETAGDPAALLEILATARLQGEDRVWADWLRAQDAASVDVRRSLFWLRSAIREAERVGSPALPRMLTIASFLAWSVGDGPAQVDLAEAFVRWAEGCPVGSDTTVPPWAALAMRGIARFSVGDVAGAEPDLTAARAQSAQWSPDPGVDLPLLVNVVLLDESLETRRRLSDARLDEAVQRLEGDAGDLLGIVRNIQAARALRRGDITMARALVDEGLDVARATHHVLNIVSRLCTNVRIDAMLGDRAALDREAAELRELSAGIGDVWGRAFADRAEGLLALSEQRYDDAVALLVGLTEAPALGRGPTDPVPMGRADLVEALSGAGDPDGARAVGHHLCELLRPSSSPVAQALIARTEGLLDRRASGIRSLETATALWREAGEAFELARTRLLMGERLVDVGRVTSASLHLHAAARSFELMGAEPWRTRCASAQERVRALVAERPDAVPAPSALSAAEMRVAMAVLDGSTNKEVAARLSLSPRTVEHHLAAAYRKLGVRSRSGLVAKLVATRE